MIDRLSKAAFLAIGALAVFGEIPAYAQIRIADDADPLLAGLAIPSNAAERGMWSATAAWPLVGLHSALTPSGTVLTYGTPQGQGVQDGRTFAIWDPVKGLGASSHTLLPNAQYIDSFCAAATNLVSGAMLISGGNTPASGFSSLASTTFDPSKQLASPVSSPMSAPRWYGSMITLADGRPLMVGGGKPYVTGAWADVGGSLARNDVSMTPEVFVAGSGWKTLPGATSRDAFGPDFNRWWYPRMWVAPSGQVFGLSSEKAWFLNPAGNGAISTRTFKTPADASAKPNIGPTSTAVMYDVGKILQVGGNGYANGHATPSSAGATIFDISNGYSATDVAGMINPRQWANATVLPNGRVLVTGGTRYADNGGGDAVLDAEIWNPAARSWTLAARAANYRGYHSAAILLQNGAVLSTGGGVPGPVTNLNAEVYYPPYLFVRSGGRSVLAARPKLATIGANAFNWGGVADIQLAGASQISSVALIGLGMTTHSFDAGQRFQRLAFTQNGLSIRATLPASANLAPPGYYQIVLVNSAGVPSRGVIVSVGAAAPQPTQTSQAVSLQSVDLTGQRVRHANFLGYLAPVSASSDVLTRADASFFVRPGLADQACFSFESKNYPGYYLRHAGFRLRLNAADGSDLFRNDATFCRRTGLAGTAFSFESKNYPAYFLRHRGADMWIDRTDGSSGFAGNATFNLVTAY